MGEEVDEGGRNNDTGSKLFQYDEDDVVIPDKIELSGQHWSENTNGTGDEDDEEQTNSQPDVVVSWSGIAMNLFFSIATNTVLDASMEVAVLLAP